MDAGLAASGLTLNNVLAIAAAALLVFVSGGVLYLSTIEWRDRRRRQQPANASGRQRR
jgi:hypothetical protein